jgi:hypothetical protein
MGSNNIIHGFSASQPSFSYRLRPPPADDFPLSRSTLPPKSPITGKKSHQSCLGGSLADDDEEAETDGKRVSEDSIDDNGSWTGKTGSPCMSCPVSMGKKHFRCKFYSRSLCRGHRCSPQLCISLRH